MVHALHEAWRVLKPNGVLIDLRPAGVHRRAGIVRGDRFQLVGTMREDFDDIRAADRALARVLHGGLFKAEQRLHIDCRRVMDTADEFQAWLDNFTRLAELPPHDWLMEKIERAQRAAPGPSQIVVKGPLVLRVLRKV
jgi:SAM-dependent methyltransferase